MKKYTSAETRSLLVSSSKEITTYKDIADSQNGNTLKMINISKNITNPTKIHINSGFYGLIPRLIHLKPKNINLHQKNKGNQRGGYC